MASAPPPFVKLWSPQGVPLSMPFWPYYGFWIVKIKTINDLTTYYCQSPLNVIIIITWSIVGLNCIVGQPAWKEGQLNGCNQSSHPSFWMNSPQLASKCGRERNFQKCSEKVWQLEKDDFSPRILFVGASYFLTPFSWGVINFCPPPHTHKKGWKFCLATMEKQDEIDTLHNVSVILRSTYMYLILRAVRIFRLHDCVRLVTQLFLRRSILCDSSSNI